MSDFKPGFKINRNVFWILSSVLLLLWVCVIIFCIRIFLLMLPLIIIIGIAGAIAKAIINRKVKKTYQEFKNNTEHGQSTAASANDKIIDVEVIKD